MLLLAFLSLDERRGGSGESLNTAVAGARAAVTDAAAEACWTTCWCAPGTWSPSGTCTTSRGTQCVGNGSGVSPDDFPRITEADLRPGVGDCRYRISTTGLDEYRHDRRAGQHGDQRRRCRMSDLTLEAYAQDLLADVLATAEAESTTAPETFTRRALDDLEQAGVTENTFTAYYRAHGVEVSGYGSNDSLGSLDSVRHLVPPVPARRQDAPC